MWLQHCIQPRKITRKPSHSGILPSLPTAPNGHLIGGRSSFLGRPSVNNIGFKPQPGLLFPYHVQLGLWWRQRGELPWGAENDADSTASHYVLGFFWLSNLKCCSGKAIQAVSFSPLLYLGPLHQTYLTSRPSSTWALRLAWQHISSPAVSESLPYEQTSHQPGWWPGRPSWASKTKGETRRSRTACGSLLPEMRRESQWDRSEDAVGGRQFDKDPWRTKLFG